MSQPLRQRTAPFPAHPASQLDLPLDRSDLLVSPACPLLGSFFDPETHYAYPSTHNRCLAAERPGQPGLQHQERFCLGGAHRRCRWYGEGTRRASRRASHRLDTARRLLPAGTARDLLLLIGVLLVAGLITLALRAAIQPSSSHVWAPRPQPDGEPEPTPLLLARDVPRAFTRAPLVPDLGDARPPRPPRAPAHGPVRAIAPEPERLPRPAAPPSAGPRLHVVESGETLTLIGVLYERTVAELAGHNRIPDPDLIYRGQVLEIP